jgi:hypothetical protein
MARFRIFLVGNPQPVDVDLPVCSAAELNDIASRVRFLQGNVTEADSDGVLPAVLLPTCRIQFIIETS